MRNGNYFSIAFDGMFTEHCSVQTRIYVIDPVLPMIWLISLAYYQRLFKENGLHIYRIFQNTFSMDLNTHRKYQNSTHRPIVCDRSSIIEQTKLVFTNLMRCLT